MLGWLWSGGGFGLHLYYLTLGFAVVFLDECQDGVEGVSAGGVSLLRYEALFDVAQGHHCMTTLAVVR